mgnify:CR=1 FL=1
MDWDCEMTSIPFKPGSGWNFASQLNPTQNEFSEKGQLKKCGSKVFRQSQSGRERLEVRFEDEIKKNYEKTEYDFAKDFVHPVKKKVSVVSRGKTRETHWADESEIDGKAALVKKKKEKKREWLARIQQNICLLCEREMKKPTIEHLIPKSLGGSDDLKNLAATCQKCNQLRGTKMLWNVKEELRLRMENRRKFEQIGKCEKRKKKRKKKKNSKKKKK